MMPAPHFPCCGHIPVWCQRLRKYPRCRIEMMSYCMILHVSPHDRFREFPMWFRVLFYYFIHMGAVHDGTYVRSCSYWESNRRIQYSQVAQIMGALAPLEWSTAIGPSRATMDSETGGDKLGHDRLKRYSAPVPSEWKWIILVFESVLWEMKFTNKRTSS